MSALTNRQLLLKEIRKFYCKDKNALLARAINKDSTYVGRLFYPADKPGAKGIGLEIMDACNATFNLKPGFWDQDATTTDDFFSVKGDYIATRLKPPPSVNETPDTMYYGWPFGARILPWQYNSLSSEQKNDIEKYVLLQIAAKDPPSEHLTPANMERTGTRN